MGGHWWLLNPSMGDRFDTCSSWLHSPWFDMTQSEIDALPRATFPGRVVTVSRPEDEVFYCQEVSMIQCSTLLGMDVEELFNIRPSSFSCSTCLVQLAMEQLCVIWRVQQNLKETRPRTGVLWFSSVLKEILCNPSILKVCIFNVPINVKLHHSLEEFW